MTTWTLGAADAGTAHLLVQAAGLDAGQCSEIRVEYDPFAAKHMGRHGPGRRRKAAWLALSGTIASQAA